MNKTAFLILFTAFLVCGGNINAFAQEQAPARAEEQQIYASQLSDADKVVKFLKDSKVFYIATIDGKQPRVRPFGAVLNIDGKVSICTGSAKNVYKQIKKNPKVEISAMTPDSKWIRLSGTLADITNEANRQKFFEASPGLKNIYSGDKEKEFTILSFKSATAVIEDFSGYKEVIELK
jgi:uncharacterized pyridoxamine 5'-phosphate oxidase family protein